MATPLPGPVLPVARPIVLVGLMGAGKSTIGRRLARRLGLPFADADEEIERAAGRTITEIFDGFGELAFRDAERRVMSGLVDGRPKVIAAGGGAFIDDATRALVLERCTAVWLDAEVDTLAERAARRDDRPLLRGREPREVLAALAERRNATYAEAHLRIVSEAEVDAVVERILAALAELRPSAR